VPQLVRGVNTSSLAVQNIELVGSLNLSNRDKTSLRCIHRLASSNMTVRHVLHALKVYPLGGKVREIALMTNKVGFELVWVRPPSRQETIDRYLRCPAERRICQQSST